MLNWSINVLWWNVWMFVKYVINENVIDLLPVLEPSTSSRFHWKLLLRDWQVNVWRGCDEEVRTEKTKQLWFGIWLSFLNMFYIARQKFRIITVSFLCCLKTDSILHDYLEARYFDVQLLPPGKHHTGHFFHFESEFHMNFNG